MLLACLCGMGLPTAGAQEEDSASRESFWEGFQWEDEIIYVLIPTKFFNGDPTNDHMLERYGDQRDTILGGGYWGGDLAGVIQKLDYLEGLGVTTLFLYPIQQNDQYNFFGWLAAGYRVKDYFAVDENLGTMEKARDLVSQAQSRGMRVILDMPLSLCGIENPLNSQEYRDAGWFTGESAWGMPVWNVSNPETAQYLINVGEFWRDELGVDGFRLDSVALLPTSFWRQFAEAIRADGNSGFFLISEDIQGPAQQQAFLDDTGFDSTYDWGMSSAIRDVFGGTDALSTISNRQNARHSAYANPRMMLNFVDNYEGETFIENSLAPKIDRMKMAMAFIMTFDRIPMLFSGNEQALAYSEVGDLFAPENQYPDFLDYISLLAAIRRQQPALRRGAYREEYRQAPILAYSRNWSTDRILVIFNRSGQIREVGFAVDGIEWKNLRLTDLLTETVAKPAGRQTTLPIDPYSALILRAEEPDLRADESAWVSYE